ncbi:MAG: sulfite exporter TauE/SafE family protein [Dissulfurispiraceae bacterium]
MSYIDSVYVLMFMTGLLGGFGHCIGMCGPVVAAYSIGLREQRYFAHLLYSLGRITTYSIMGGMIGMTGSFLGVAGSIGKAQGVVVALVGGVMIVMGLGITGWIKIPRSKGKIAGNRLVSFLLRSMRLISEARGIGIYFPMGLVLGFMPCGLLYTVLIAAAGAGAAASNQVKGLLSGMVMLFLFGLGTVPALFLLGQLASTSTERIRGTLYKASGVLMIVAGIVFIYRSLQ